VIDMAKMIEAQGLTKRYEPARSERRQLARRGAEAPEGTLAVDDVSFTVDEGELFVIMGLSGSGKSTLLRMLNRLIDPTSGSLRIAGQDLLSMDDVELRQVRNSTVNMVFQHFALFPHRTVRENAAYGLQVRGVPEAERLERAQAALETVGLGQWGQVRPQELSGGMRQRVGLARALATDAQVLLMDEPFSALDPLIRRDMQDLLLSLQAEMRKTIVFVTHDLNEAMRLGHRIMVMREGRVVQLASGAEILASPADDYVANFVSDVDRSRVVTAEHIMRPPLITARTGEDPRSVLDRMENAEAIGVYVLDDVGKLIGAVRDQDLADGIEAGCPRIESLVSDSFATTTRDARLIEVMPVVGRHCVPLAVTDDDGRLLGVIPRAALLNTLADQRRPAHA
jgi:glycine betaine/proline transport system ATP-binding protein